jgi:ribosome-binding protein aMBF1 (putative translation factor)
MNKGALERLQERIRTADRGWFFAAVADKVSERRQAVGLSQRELAELVGTTQSAIARLGGEAGRRGSTRCSASPMRSVRSRGRSEAAPALD